MTHMVNQAISLAATWHAGQVDKAGVNYIRHPMRVMLACGGLGEEYEAAAVLHDVVEDTPVTLDMLRAEGFPESVVEAVDALSRREGERYRDFIVRCAANPIARAVKLADISDNLSRMTPELEGLQRRYFYAREALHAAGKAHPVFRQDVPANAEWAEQAWTGRRDRMLKP